MTKKRIEGEPALIDPDHNSFHSNVREKKFIDGLGGWAGITKTRRELLRGYIIALDKRVNWGNLEKKEIVKYANKRLFES